MFRARRGILEVVFALVLGHPSALHERGNRAGVVGAEAFPAVQVRVQFEKFTGSPEVVKAIRVVEFDAVNWVEIRRPKIHEPAVGFFIMEKSRIPRTCRTGHLGQQRIEMFEPASFRRGGHPDRTLLKSGLKKIELAADGDRSRSAHVFLGPLMRRDVGFDKPPVDEVLRVPPTAGDSNKKKILALVINDDGIGAGTIGDATGFLFEVVLIIDVHRIAVGLLSDGLGVAWLDHPNHQCKHRQASKRGILHPSTATARHQIAASHSFFFQQKHCHPGEALTKPANPNRDREQGLSPSPAPRECRPL